MSERLDKFLEEYSKNDFLDIYNFFTKEQFEIIKKVGLNIENRNYSVSDYDALKMQILKVYNDESTSESDKKDCEVLLGIFDKISNEYNL